MPVRGEGRPAYIATGNTFVSSTPGRSGAKQEPAAGALRKATAPWPFNSYEAT
jgi:hypothetical protein